MSIRRPLSVVLGSVALAATAACDAITGAEFRTEPALIIFYRDTAAITAPDTVARGEDFSVRIRTFGGGCTRETVRADVSVTGSLAELKPFNRTRNANVCTADLLNIEHSVRVRFDIAGRALLRVIGEQRGASTGAANGPAVLERSLVVR
jgi:hypothetical protein